MLTANGLTLPLNDWAQRLGVSPYAITHAIAEGLTVQDVVDAYQPSTPPRPSTPNNLVGAHAGPLLQTPGGSFTFKTLCVACADQAKNYYDLAHTAHKEQQKLEERAKQRAWADQMFNFVNLEGGDASGPSRESPA